MHPDHHDAEGWQRLVQGLLVGEAQAIEDFCQRYRGILRAIANQEIGPAMRRRFDASEVVDSALCSFFRRARDRQFTVTDAEKLWSLLCAITLTKVREKARFHTREKRDIAREAAVEPGPGEGAAGWEIADPHLTPAEAAEIADQFRQFVQSLDHEQQQIVAMKLEDCRHAEIADALNVSERTVERQMDRLYRRLKRLLQGE